jgi:hypothetical protein
MNTLFVRPSTKIIRNGGYERIVFLDAGEFARLEKCGDQEKFIADLDKSQVVIVKTPK